MKKIIQGFLFSLMVSSLAFAAETKKGSAETTVEESTSYNPLTDTTTRKEVKKSKRKIKHEDGSASEAEHTHKVKRKTSRDGKKSTVTTEDTQTEENK